MRLNQRQEVLASIVAYSFCSGTLVLLNKFTLYYLPFPSLVVSFQLFACIAAIYGARALGKLEVDEIKWEFVKPYLIYTIFFAMGVYCNMRSLNISNVETVIVFRALSPIIVAFLDVLCLGREWPSNRSWFGLFILVAGAYGYASYDEKFQNQGYSAYVWPFFYLMIISFEMAYGKNIVKSVPLKTRSGPVIYTNLLGFVPMLVFAAMGNEYSKFYNSLWDNTDYRIPPASIPFLMMGSLVGMGIGYSGWWCRSVVSATSYTLIGVMNKCLTIILNTLAWDQHANTGGIASLFICILGGLVYQQAPMRSEKPKVTMDAEDDAFKSDVSVEAHTNEETMELLEKQEETQAKRRG